MISRHLTSMRLAPAILAIGLSYSSRRRATRIYDTKPFVFTPLVLAFTILATAFTRAEEGVVVHYDTLNHDHSDANNSGRATKTYFDSVNTVNDLVAQQFTTGNSGTISKITVGLGRIGDPGGSLQFQIWDVDSNSGDPGAHVATLGSVPIGSLDEYPGGYGSVPFLGTKTVEGKIEGLSPNTSYYLILAMAESPTLGSPGTRSWAFSTVNGPKEYTPQETLAFSPRLTNGTWIKFSSILPASVNYLHARIEGSSPTHTLTITPNDHGTVTASPEGPYSVGTEVTLTATPNEGYQFSKWLIGEDEFTDNPLTFTIEADTTVTPEFVETFSNKSVVHFSNLDDPGNPDQGFRSRKIGPTPGDGGAAQRFTAGEFGNVTAVTFGLARVGSPGGHMVVSIREVAPNGYPGETIGVVGTTPINEARVMAWPPNIDLLDLVKVEGLVEGLVPGEDYFVYIVHDDEARIVGGAGPTHVPFVDAVQSPTDATPVAFEGPNWKRPWSDQRLRVQVEGALLQTLTIPPSDHGTVTVSPEGPYTAGTEVTLTATPNEDYQFSQWLIGEDEFNDNPLTYTIEADTTVTPKFTSAGAILYDNFPDELPNFRDGIDVGPPGIAQLQPVHAQPFFTGEYGSIASVSVTMINDNGEGSVDLVLAEDDNGRPGQTIATLGTIDLATLPEWQNNDAVGTVITFNTEVTGLRPNGRYFIGFDQAKQINPEGNAQRTFYNLFQKNPDGNNGAGVAVVGPFGDWLPLSDFRPDANYMMMRVVEGPAPSTDPFIIDNTEEGSVTADPNLDTYPVGSEVTVTARHEVVSNS